MVLYVVLAIPVALALWAALGRREPALMAAFVALSLVGAAAFVAARPAFEMQALSAGYALATTDAQRALFLAAGEAALATFHGTAFWVSYALGAVGGLVLAAAMLRTAVFGRTAAYLRIGSSVLEPRASSCPRPGSTSRLARSSACWRSTCWSPGDSSSWAPCRPGEARRHGMPGKGGRCAAASAMPAWTRSLPKPRRRSSVIPLACGNVQAGHADPPFFMPR